MTTATLFGNIAWELQWFVDMNVLCVHYCRKCSIALDNQHGGSTRWLCIGPL
eukprot:m.406914 g.406914  ORF g.406914 m.406914 type:complete len:52 (-) comp21218_c1_seq3:837-992(-)